MIDSRTVRIALAAVAVSALVACGGDPAPGSSTTAPDVDPVDEAQASANSAVDAATEAPPSAELDAAAPQTAATAHPTRTQMAEFGGASHAAAELCGGYSAAQLADMKQQQRQGYVSTLGGTEAEFDAAFKAGQAKATARIEQASAAERTQACEQLQQLMQR